VSGYIRIVPPFLGEKTNLPTSGHLVDVTPPEIEAVFLCLVMLREYNTYLEDSINIFTTPD
tara:strand:+ start:26544 stop:26726 length:183 start_codon:yes stop_codon:yes gene_type:complete